MQLESSKGRAEISGEERQEARPGQADGMGQDNQIRYELAQITSSGPK